jgi:hypothetical protein
MKPDEPQNLLLLNSVMGLASFYSDEKEIYLNRALGESNLQHT